MSTIIKDDVIKIIQHPGQGFFSCCTIHLQRILTFFNTYYRLPKHVDSTEQFIFYKTPQNWSQDIKPDYFDANIQENISWKGQEVKVTDLDVEEQYSDYRHLNFMALAPFIRRYFSPSTVIQELIEGLQEKYSMNYANTCVLFYRGNDKASEVTLPRYERYLEAANAILQQHPQMRFLVQSDETEFLELMKRTYPTQTVIFQDEIRHMPRTMTTVDKVFRHQNAVMSKFYLAITYIMSRCRYVVCNSGNCSFWIVVFRGNTDGVVQF